MKLRDLLEQNNLQHGFKEEPLNLAVHCPVKNSLPKLLLCVFIDADP